jgi:1-acyl-sn-glycerol-3-phosphate acyltransferase
MGLRLSLMTLFEMARITAPTFAESFTGGITREKCDKRLHAWARRVVDRARIQIEVIGRDRVPTDRAFVFMSNHQSHLDVPVLYSTIPTQTLRMIGKTELFQVPIWGRAMRAGGMVEINRESRSQAIESLRRAGEAIRDGVSIWIAPEGTRSRTGELGELKKGGFHLASGTHTEIVPIALNGTIHILPPKSVQMTYDVPVTVEFGAPIPVEDRPVDDLMDDVREFLSARVAR